MVPSKVTGRPAKPIATKRMMTRRTQNSQMVNKMISVITTDRMKRKAESPPRLMVSKRSAFGNLTNAVGKNNTVAPNDKAEVCTKKIVCTGAKKVTVQAKVLPILKTIAPRTIKSQTENIPPGLEPVLKKPVTRASLRSENNAITNLTAQKPKEVLRPESKVKTRLSNEFDKTNESLYTSALENLCDSVNAKSKTQIVTPYKTPLRSPFINDAPVDKVHAFGAIRHLNIGNHTVPSALKDFDKENWNDVFQVSHYAMDIFNYMKNQEAKFEIKPYMEKQVCLTAWMRSLLIDWMVEVQESFELNHETLYLGVKLVDYYLSKVIVGKETLQLVGAAAMFIASKYDERIPPLIDDFLYICDGAYSRRELIRMEMNVLKICDFNLGIPLSYRFLRRFGRCAKVSMPVLTLARYILEFTLMDYSVISLSDSKLASAALYLAIQMKKISGWTPTLEFYTGYTLPQFIGVVLTLNNILHKKPKEQLSTVRNKYSHKIFFEVAKTELIASEKLYPPSPQS